MTNTADGVLNGLLDATFAYDYVGTQRVLVLQGSEKVVAGHRINGHFTTPKGKAIRSLDMKSSPEESYAQLLKAFRNEVPKRKYKRPA